MKFATAIAAPGVLEVEGEKFALTHVYARKAPSTFDKDTESLYILAVDRELPPDVRVNGDVVRRMVWDNELNGIDLEFKDDSVSWLLKTSAAGGSASGSRSPNPYKLETTTDQVTGRVEIDQRESSFAKYFAAFDIDAAIERYVAPPAPTAADTAAAQVHPATKVYFEFQEALMKGDKETMMKLVDPEKAAMMDTPEFPEMLSFIRDMQAKIIQVLKVVDDGDTATLTVIGDAGKQTGDAAMERRNGQWLLMNENWTDA